MSGPIPVETAREQLRELISILGELRNAGPRDQRFKQWRQITVTLLQRLWPGEPSRAERFRRIPFSAPSARSDRHATREYFERGCKEASTYLAGLALELGCVIEPLSELPTVEGEPTPSMEEHDVVDLPNADMSGGEDAPGEMSWPDDVVGEDPPARNAPKPAEARKPATGQRPRLKDMLGFTDQAAPDHTRAPDSSEATPTPAPRASSEAAPVKFKPLAPVPARDPVPMRQEPPPPMPSESSAHGRVEPPPTGRREPETDQVETRRDLAAEFVLESAVLQSRARSTREPESVPTPAAMSPAARDVMELAGRVEALGVPARESAILRATLIDLARQMETPPIHWEALRNTVGFAMDYPDLARRLMPLVMPYLDRAA